MDINMRNVELFKDGNWIKIKTGEIKENNKTINVGTKLLYDDGKYSDSTQLKLLRDRVRDLAGYNDTDSWDKSLSMIDWFTTLGLSFYGAYTTTEGLYSKPLKRIMLRIAAENYGVPFGEPMVEVDMDIFR